MTRILGEHFNSDGKPKTGYSDEWDARIAADWYGISYYRCDFCGEWHIGNMPEW